MKILGKCSTRVQLLLHRFPLHLGKTNTTWVLPLDLSIFLSILDCPSPVQHIERGLQEWETTRNVFKCAVRNGWCELFSRDPTRAQDVWVWEECNKLWCDQLCNKITRDQQTKPALTHTFAFVHLIAWSWDNTDLTQDGDEYSRHFTFRISSECFVTNFWVMLNRLSISLYCVLVDLRIREIIWPDMDCGNHRQSQIQSPCQYICFACVHWELLFACWHSQSLFAGTERSCSCIDGSCSPCFIILVLTQQDSLCYWSYNVLTHHCVCELILLHAVSSCCWNIILSLAWEYPISDLEAERMLLPAAISPSFLSSVFTGLTDIRNFVKRFLHSSGHEPSRMVSRSPSVSLHSKSSSDHFLTWRSDFQPDRHKEKDWNCKCSTKCLSLVVPWVLTGTHRCALMPRVASRQSANPFAAGVVLKSCGDGRGRRDVLSWTFWQML